MGNVIMHVMPEGEEGDYGISFTRLRGDTFKFHALFRALRDRLADVIASADELSRFPPAQNGPNSVDKVAAASSQLPDADIVLRSITMMMRLIPAVTSVVFE